MRAFRAILWKEWLSLKPFAWLLVALFFVGLILVQATQYFDDYAFWPNVLSDPVTISGVTFVLALVVSLGLMIRESDEGTLLYLDGLPVRRLMIYFAKWLVAIGLISAINLVWFVEGLVYDALSRNSASPPVPWRSYFVFLALELFLGVFFVTVLVCFSFLRRWALLALGAVFWILFWMNSLQVPYAEILNPFLLIQPPSEIESDWEWPTLRLVVLSMILLVSWWTGYLLFSLRLGWARSVQRVLRETWWGKLTGGCSIVLIIVVWFAYGIVMTWDEGIEEIEEMEKQEKEERERIKSGNNILTDETDHFRFIYRGKQEKRMKRVLAQADPVQEKVADFLEVPAEMREDLITVDLSSPLAAHNAGQAYWKKIRMALPKEAGKGKKREAETLAILGHELAHVFIDQITKGRLEESFNSARWFHEGLASYIEFRLFRPEGADKDYRRWVGLASKWGEVHFPEMVNSAGMMRVRDANLVYPAGYLWVDSLVRVYGDDAPAKLLAAIGREDGPAKLEGMALWRDGCLACDFDLERIRSDFRKQLDELRDEADEAFGELPEIAEGEAKREEGELVLTPELPEDWESIFPEESRFVARFRPRKDAGPTQWRHARLEEDETFRVSALSFLSKEVGFQFGIQFEGQQPVFGEWVNVTVED
ncbi:MAG: ABC transporter permease [Verrucomicrobiota bacterium]